MNFPCVAFALLMVNLAYESHNVVSASMSINYCDDKVSLYLFYVFACYLYLNLIHFVNMIITTILTLQRTCTVRGTAGTSQNEHWDHIFF